MPRLQANKSLSLVPRGNHYEVHFGYNAKLLTLLKSVPGVHADYEGKSFRCWLVPQDAWPHLAGAFEEEGYNQGNGPPSKWYTAAELGATNDNLHPYQIDAVHTALGTTGYMFNLEMGLGKTPVAIEVCRLAHHQRILIVCPALVREHWKSEFKRWWIDRKPIAVVESGAHTDAASSVDTIITSYELLRHFRDWQGDCVIVDESHYIKSDRAGRSKMVKEIRYNNPDAQCLLLTGTPLTEPQDLWHQWEVALPGAPGKRWHFCNAYCGRVSNKFATKGYDWKGLNSPRAEELRARLAAWSVRTTKQEVQHLLPPFSVVPYHVRLKGKQPNLRELYEHLGSGIRKQHNLEAAIAAAGAGKIGLAVVAAADAVEQEQQVAALAWYKKTAKAIASELGKKHDVVYVDGDLPVKKRIRTIGKAKEQGALLVGTIASLNVGIDLTHWTTAVVAELYWQPAAMVQLMGRFSRLTGKAPSTVQLLIAKGTIDEPIAHVLMRRLREQGELFKEGQAEQGLSNGLAGNQTDFWEELKLACENRLEDDAYL